MMLARPIWSILSYRCCSDCNRAPVAQLVEHRAVMREVVSSSMSSMFISSLWDVKKPKHYSRRVGYKVPGVVAVLFSQAKVAGLAVMSLKRLVVYEAT